MFEKNIEHIEFYCIFKLILINTTREVEVRIISSYPTYLSPYTYYKLRSKYILPSADSKPSNTPSLIQTAHTRKPNPH